jgi:hypothetical protein
MVAQTKTKPRRRQTGLGRKTKLSDSLDVTVTTPVSDEKKSILLGEAKETTLKIKDIRTDGGTQPRGVLDTKIISKYAKEMKEGVAFPPVVVFYDGENYYLADGFHRIAGRKEANQDTTNVDIKMGTLSEAQWYSYSVNVHGLPRSTEDKKRAIEAALSHPKAATMNDSELGRYLKVSSNTVKAYREKMGIEKPEKRNVTRNGKTHEQTVNSAARSAAQLARSKGSTPSQLQLHYNKYEFWEQNGEWDIPIPNDFFNSNIVVTFTVHPTPDKYQFIFKDKQKSLFSEDRSLIIEENEEKEAATPFLYAQGVIKEWVEEEAKRKKELFEIKDAGFHTGVRVTHRLHRDYGEGTVCQINNIPGCVTVKFDIGLKTEQKPIDLEIIPVKVWAIGDVVKIAKSYKRTNWEWWCRQDKVQVTQKHDNNLYEVKDFNRAEGKRKSLIFHWWELETLAPNMPNEEEKIKAIEEEVLIGLEEQFVESAIEEEEKDLETSKVTVEDQDGEPDLDDYYQQALDCLPELSDRDLLKLKFNLEREIKMRGLVEENDDLQKFQSELVKYAASRKTSPEAWAATVVNNHKKGQHSPLWDDFIKGQPLGSGSQIKRDWEIEPGMPYPAFKEERTQYYIAKGEPIESAIVKAGNELRNPELAKDLWEGFLRKSDRIADDALKAKALGVIPYLPPAFSEGVVITKESVMAKLEAVADARSLPEAKPETQPEQSEIKSDEPAAKPTIEELQKCLDFRATSSITKIRIRENPQWGYAIVEEKVVDIAEEQVKSSALNGFGNLIAILKSEAYFLAITSYANKIQLFDYNEDNEWGQAGFLHPIEPDSTNWQAYYDCLENPKILWLNEDWDFTNNIFVCKGGHANG